MADQRGEPRRRVAGLFQQRLNAAAGSAERVGFDAAGHSVGAVIGELHIDAEIGVAEELDDGLQDVAVAAGDTDEIALDGGLHFKQIGRAHV